MSNRISKVNDLIRDEISKVLVLEVNDPELGIVTIKDVDTTADLRYADVWVSIMSADPEKSFSLIEKSVSRIQKILNSKLRMKYVPKITFRMDSTEKHAERIEELIKLTKLSSSRKRGSGSRVRGNDKF